MDYEKRRQAAIAAGVAVIHAALGYYLILPSVIDVPPREAALSVFEVPPPPTPPKEEPKPAKPRTPKPEGAASAANRKAKPKPVVAPPPKVRIEVPPPVVAPPIASTGPDASAGAANIEGPGTGAGGTGVGLGSGGQGTGTGGGGGNGARWLKGRIKDSDYPRPASREKVGGTVVVNFDVGTDGRVSNCRIVASSGNDDLDETTCRLIMKRFRYQPATDAQGRPIPSTVGWKQFWWLEPND